MAARVPFLAFHKTEVQHLAAFLRRDAPGQGVATHPGGQAEHPVIEIRRRAVTADGQIRRQILGVQHVGLGKVEGHAARDHLLVRKHAVKPGNVGQTAGLELPEFIGGMHRLNTEFL